jgi:hypothetical protein
MVTMTNNHNLFPLPYWAPALRRVPIPLQLLDEAYLRGERSSQSALLETSAAEPVANLTRSFRSPLLAGRGR